MKKLRILLLALAAARVPAQTQVDICSNTTVPPGWVVVNTKATQNTCNATIGNKVSNVWTIENAAAKPVGTTMSVCGFSPIPPGWVVMNRAIGYAACILSLGGQGAVAQIKKVQ